MGSASAEGASYFSGPILILLMKMASDLHLHADKHTGMPHPLAESRLDPCRSRPGAVSAQRVSWLTRW